MADAKEWEKPFELARDAIQRGDFDETKKSLESLGFKFKETTDPNHWMYYHPALREDAHFRYPRNLYRPHGSRRSGNRIGKHDETQAKQMVDVLRSITESRMAQEGGTRNEPKSK